ncbi:hypothetical protein [Streptomyces griseosporeus]|uniref:hypothetical protein n=1 Tax=Streptomyces griseosporeus TaxID=1910 RepID=UPI0036A3C1F1
MGNRADEYGTDVEIYRRWLNPTIYVETPTGAPAKLLDQLDQLGFERHQFPAPEPVYIWHEVPAHLDSAEQQRLATRAIPTLLLAGYKVNCTPEVFDQAAYQQALHDIRFRHLPPDHPPARRPCRHLPAPRAHRTYPVNAAGPQPGPALTPTRTTTRRSP